MLTDEGTAVVKVFLHISKDERPPPGPHRRSPEELEVQAPDLETRKRWDDFQRRYDDVIGATSTEWAPWNVVPADHNGARRWRWRACWSNAAAAASTPASPTRSRGSWASWSSSGDRSGVDWSRARPIGQNGRPMDVESRDSVSLKPAELDELWPARLGRRPAVVRRAPRPPVEQFPLVRSRPTTARYSVSCSGRSSASAGPRASSGVSAGPQGSPGAPDPRRAGRWSSTGEPRSPSGRGRAGGGAHRPPGARCSACSA